MSFKLPWNQLEICLTYLVAPDYVLSFFFFFKPILWRLQHFYLNAQWGKKKTSLYYHHHLLLTGSNEILWNDASLLRKIRREIEKEWGHLLWRIEEMARSKRDGEGGQVRPRFNKAWDLLSALTPFKWLELNGPSVGLPVSCCAYNQMCTSESK